jgi:hypothetical protein
MIIFFIRVDNMEVEKSLCQKRLKQLTISPLHKDNPGLEQNKKKKTTK